MRVALITPVTRVQIPADYSLQVQVHRTPSSYNDYIWVRLWNPTMEPASVDLYFDQDGDPCFDGPDGLEYEILPRKKMVSALES